MNEEKNKVNIYDVVELYGNKACQFKKKRFL